MRDMEWYVYINNFNGSRIEKYNIFEHGGFNEAVRQAYKQYKDDFPEFSTEVKRKLMYLFWSKCEWEIILHDWPESDRCTKKKIDVYQQVMLNWDVFIKYVWDMAHARKTPAKKKKKEEKE